MPENSISNKFCWFWPSASLVLLFPLTSWPPPKLIVGRVLQILRDRKPRGSPKSRLCLVSREMWRPCHCFQTPLPWVGAGCNKDDDAGKTPESWRLCYFDINLSTWLRKRFYAWWEPPRLKNSRVVINHLNLSFSPDIWGWRHERCRWRPRVDRRPWFSFHPLLFLLNLERLVNINFHVERLVNMNIRSSFVSFLTER